MELLAALIASSMLLAGLGSVMLIGRQIAYTPSAALHRTETADVISQITDELQYATFVIGQTPHVLEFVVADRNADGTSEKIRYEWSGTAGNPLYKTINGGTPTIVLDTVNQFDLSYLLKAKSTTLTATTDSGESVLVSNTGVTSGVNRDITTAVFSGQQINPTTFASPPANALYWNATKVEFYGRQNGSTTDTLLVQLRPAGEPCDSPTSDVLGQVSMAESAITAAFGWNTATFASPVRELSLNRRYAIALAGQTAGTAVRLNVYDSATAGGVLESNDSGATWQLMSTPFASTSRQMYYKLYGTYTTSGPTYAVTRNYISHVRILLQSATQSHARIDASVPLINSPEYLSAYWRTDFDRNPTTTNGNGDAVSDWAWVGSGSFSAATLINGVWYASGALETRPLADFTQTTIVKTRCRNTSVGGNGAVLRINADRQGGQYAPLHVYVQRLADGTQSLTLVCTNSPSESKQLFSRSRLSSDFVRIGLTIVPQSNVVNLTINDEDQGTFAYPTYTPPNNTDRFVTIYADTSLAEFDYVDVRVTN